MSALDQAFIKAYAKEPPRDSADTTAGADVATIVAHVSAPVSGAPRPVEHSGRAQIENIYANGALYRIEIPLAQEPEPVPPPHYPMRGSRRVVMRHRLHELANQEDEHTGRRAPARSPSAAAPAARRVKARIPVPPMEDAYEPAQAAPAVVIPPPESILPLAPSVEVRQEWDGLLENSVGASDCALVVWPEQQDFAQADNSSLIALDLQRMPEAPATVSELVLEPLIEPAVAPAASPSKTFRIDDAHQALPEPHKPEQKSKSRPLAISDEEAAVLAGAEIPPSQPAKPVTLPISRPLIPAWEVDRFLWPALCEKLLKDEQSYFAQAGGKIASAVRDGLKSLAITGSRRGEGRTTLALCLARSAARAGLKVALVDADFSRPQLAGVLGLETAGSWPDAALGGTPLSEVAIKSLEDNLVVLPLDVSHAATSLSLADARLTATLREAAGAFDLLVLDLGPISTGSEPLFPAQEAPPADAAIVVRDLRYAALAESQAIGERLCASGIEAVGIAENFVPPEKLAA